MENDIIILDSVEQFNRQCGFETLHPLVTVVDMAKSTNDFGSQRMHYRLYALWLKNGEGCRLKYGRCYYDYDEGSVVSFAPGQVIQPEPLSETPQSVGLLFHPDLIHGTSLGRKMERYTFFSYNEAEALHLSERERCDWKASTKNSTTLSTSTAANCFATVSGYCLTSACVSTTASSSPARW